ncbi:MAG: type II/IV secretion system protein [Burkholderiales bacterium]|nr:MAG: type II/IV secretion system protein [Burkholderiales bacterium]
MKPTRRIRIGEMLLEAGLLSAEQLEHALDEQRRSGRRLGRVLVDSGLIDELLLARMLAEQLGLRFVDLRTEPIDRRVAQRLPEQRARRHRALVLGESADGALRIGMADPTDLQGYDELARVLNSALEPNGVAESHLLAALDRVYQGADDLTDIARELKADLAPDASMLSQIAGRASDDSTPVARLLSGVFEDAVRARASDIHFEPESSRLTVRFRVDGALRTHTRFDAEIASALALRLKLISNLDISERRMPQDGRFEVSVRGTPVDMRISIMPSHWGESVVVRLLDAARNLLSIDAMGMPPHVERQVRHAIERPNGMVVVTGPTGSGKTTTLYGLLDELRNESRKLVTVEDPIEYRLKGVTQIQVHERIALTFARVLRSVLRHDPDVVMVGEMRDSETAEIGVRAAMTGHLVLSTLHTNSAIGTPARLADMGVPSYMLASSLQLVIAQRLVRRLCEMCRKPAAPTPQELAWLDSVIGAEHAARLTPRAAPGCPHCGQTGYHGRAAAYESLELSRALTDALARGDDEGFLVGAREQLAGRTLAHDAVRLVRDGITDLDEAMRVSALTAEDD